jgi:hypothetical protein
MVVNLETLQVVLMVVWKVAMLGDNLVYLLAAK